METQNDLKVAVIRQELLELTGDYRQAIILNQFIYWTPRVKDHDLFLREEHVRSQNMKVEFRNGWIYKTAKELANETMLGFSPSSIRRHTIELVKKGWLQERANPKHKWDKTLQYRLNTVKLKKDLLKLGYVINIGRKYAVSKIENRETETETHEEQNRKAIPESTSEITLENTFKNTMGSPVETRERPIHFEEYNFTDDYKEEVVSYYMESYLLNTNKKHPKLKPSQWERVDDGLNKIDNVELGMEYIPDVNVWKDVIDQHFTTNYNSCDYNILHFIEDGIKVRRMYEAGYQ